MTTYRTLWTAALLLMLLRVYAGADGLSMSEDGLRYLGDHTVFTLAAEQSAEVERTRRVTLTAEQRSLILPLNRCLPAELPVISSRYGDCTCGLGPVAIWARRGEVIIPHDYIDLDFLYDGEPPEVCPPLETEAEYPPDWNPLEVYFDSAAGMWVNGLSLPSDRLEAEVRARLGAGRSAILVYLPPPLDPDLDSQFKASLERLKDLATELNVEFSWRW